MFHRPAIGVIDLEKVEMGEGGNKQLLLLNVHSRGSRSSRKGKESNNLFTLAYLQDFASTRLFAACRKTKACHVWVQKSYLGVINLYNLQ